MDEKLKADALMVAEYHLWATSSTASAKNEPHFPLDVDAAAERLRKALGGK